MSSAFDSEASDLEAELEEFLLISIDIWPLVLLVLSMGGGTPPGMFDAVPHGFATAQRCFCFASAVL